MRTGLFGLRFKKVPKEPFLNELEGGWFFLASRERWDLGYVEFGSKDSAIAVEPGHLNFSKAIEMPDRSDTRLAQPGETLSVPNIS